MHPPFPPLKPGREYTKDRDLQRERQSAQLDKEERQQFYSIVSMVVFIIIFTIAVSFYAAKVVPR